MKILLIQPYSKFFATYPPLGLLYLAAYIREKRNHEIRLLDMRTKRATIDQLVNTLASFKPDIVGISGMSIEFEGIFAVARTVKSVSSSIIIAGGPHATTFPESTLIRGPIDYIVIGEGEKTFLELLDAIQKKKRISTINGIAYRNKGGIIMSPPRPPIADLDSLPLPAWDLLDLEDYFANPISHNVFQVKKRFMPIMTSRGCPHHCIYCNHILGYRHRRRSPEHVLSEIDHLVRKYAIEEIHIEDDSFSMDIPRAKEIFRAIIDRQYNLYIAFPSGIRADRIDAELARLLRRGGTYRVSIGIESASERIQKMINKKIDLATVTKAIALLTGEGINTNGFFMIGFPTETKEDMLATIDFAVASNLTTAYFSKVTMFPGTPLHAMFKDTLNTDDLYEEYFAFKSNSHNLSTIDDRVLAQLYKLAFRKFYFNPKRLIGIYKTSPNKKRYFRFCMDQVRRQLFTPERTIDIDNITAILKSLFGITIKKK